jgi:hypothetical protein
MTRAIGQGGWWPIRADEDVDCAGQAVTWKNLLRKCAIMDAASGSSKEPASYNHTNYR